MRRKVSFLTDQAYLISILNNTFNAEFENIFYSSMIQNGVKEFEILQYSDIHSDLIKKPKFISDRISLTSNKNVYKTNKIIDETFRNNILLGNKKFNNLDILLNVLNIRTFLENLFLALERNTSIVYIPKMPNLILAKDLIAPKFFYNLQLLYNSFDLEEAKLPLPKTSVNLENVNIFQDIIQSDLFDDYVSTHIELENNKLVKRKAIQHLIKRGNILYQKYIKSLSLKNIKIALLTITPEIINTIFGKLPGRLAEYSANLLDKRLKEDKRIVLYHFNPIFQDILLQSKGLKNMLLKLNMDISSFVLKKASGTPPQLLLRITPSKKTLNLQGRKNCLKKNICNKPIIDIVITLEEKIEVNFYISKWIKYMQ